MVLQNIKQALKNIRKPRVTRMYPEERPVMPERFRGLQKLDKSKCIGCGICANTCPNNTIRIVRARVSPNSEKTRWFPEIDIGHCLFCGLCIDQCPQDALSSTGVFTTGVIRWTHEELLYTPEMLAREVPVGEEDE
ncbi:NADH-quinone oxidoreductase subunit I [Methanohalophilus levihalophilus]|uniref:F420H2 dehydrogenase subunit FpoI n=1 Tax=Methanohalophilus levihalophilus TaxID=1431282 RepID=UPI001AE3ECE4|nr:F420H2 dehydrogenase subunit FpoI [Methanohalophilus levihalophilus]MBP2030982.1 NADH-quinone oxidoreductase subunit I [Methanohalophilus levihalophilus]